MDAILIARTEPRERMDVDCGWTVTEYRLRDAGYTGSGFYVDMRHVRTVKEGLRNQVTEEDWQLWQVGTTKEAAVAEGMGDTAYEEANSLHPLHKVAVERIRLVRAAYNRVYAAEKALKAAQEEVASYKFQCNQEFTKKTRGVDDLTKIERTKQRMLKTRGPIMDNLKAEVEKAKEELEAANKATKALGIKDS